MLNSRRVAVVMPAYNAATTLAKTFAELDLDVIDEVVLVDDASTDQTITLARELGLEPISHERNLGYGETQLLKKALRGIIRETDPGPPPLMSPTHPE